MVSKIVGFLAIFLVMVLLISSEVTAARELIETTNDKASDKASGTVHPDQFGYGWGPGSGSGSGNICQFECCGFIVYGNCNKCCKDPITDTP